jgi:hypothetical protein
MTFTVTATELTQGVAGGIAGTIKVLTGAKQVGAVAPFTSITPNNPLTPLATGSIIYSSVLGINGTYTVVAGTVTEQDFLGVGLELLQCRASAVTSAGVPQTVGYTATVNGISQVLAEIEALTTLAEDASSPAPFASQAGTAITSPAFSPPAGSLLMLAIASNGSSGSVTFGITDTSGLGLTWTEAVRANTAGDGYSGIWTAQLPAAPSSSTWEGSIIIPVLNSAGII